MRNRDDLPGGGVSSAATGAIELIWEDLPAGLSGTAPPGYDPTTIPRY